MLPVAIKGYWVNKTICILHHYDSYMHLYVFLPIGNYLPTLPTANSDLSIDYTDQGQWARLVDSQSQCLPTTLKPLAAACKENGET